MATSNTATFNLDLADIIEEAYERAGLELRSGYDYATARRSINLICAEWANKGLNLWTVEEGSLTLVDGQSTYPLPADTVDLIEHSVRENAGNVTSQTDLVVTRISVSQYSAIPNKLTTGRPTQIYVDRQIIPQVSLWPVPDSTTRTLIFYRLRRIQDAGSPASNDMDIPVRFMPALCAALAYHISMKNPESQNRTQILKTFADEAFDLAAAEDRDRSSITLTPGAPF
tara:strand:+ start:384 stop:1067 length:684 start_codon:yes stop_codon:yes gene_type:complete